MTVKPVVCVEDSNLKPVSVFAELLNRTSASQDLSRQGRRIKSDMSCDPLSCDILVRIVRIALTSYTSSSASLGLSLSQEAGRGIPSGRQEGSLEGRL